MAHARFGGSFSVGAAALLEQALHGGHRLGSYVAVGLVTGLRTEELRVLRWRQVDLDAGTVLVTWADRFGGDTKTPAAGAGCGWPTSLCAPCSPLRLSRPPTNAHKSARTRGKTATVMRVLREHDTGTAATTV